MAEAIGIASGCIALTQFAIRSSVALYQTIQTFQSHSQRVRDLCDEVQALNGVLGSLATTTASLKEFDLSTLCFPLLRCGKACEDFEALLQKVAPRGTSDRKVFREWAKLRFMGEDIDYFRRLLSSYKMTINVALSDITIRTGMATTEQIELCTSLLASTKADLEDQLYRMNEKLELIGDAVVGTQIDADEVKSIKDERKSTEQCLQICAKLSEHIMKVQLTTSQISGTGDHREPLAAGITGRGLQECKDSLDRVIRNLQEREKVLFHRLLDRTKMATVSQEEQDDLTRLREEWEAFQGGMNVCTQVQNHLAESVSTIDNYGTGDALQFMVSTGDKTIRGSNRGVGWRTRQVGGHIDPASFQRLVQSLESMNVPTRQPHDQSAGGFPVERSTGKEVVDEASWQRYGRGVNLGADSPAGAPTQSMT